MQNRLGSLMQPSKKSFYPQKFSTEPTCLWHVSMQAAMCQRLGNMPKACPYAMVLSYFFVFFSVLVVDDVAVEGERAQYAPTVADVAV